MIRRVFYVVFFQNEHVQKCLDAVCLICNPREKRRAHITVRGPYRQRMWLPVASPKCEGLQIDVVGVDAFEGVRQQTVFLRCESDELKEVWRKPDFGYHPHITLFDGPSKEFAKSLLSRLKNIDLRFSVTIGRLEPIESVKDGQGKLNLELRSEFDGDFVSEILNRRINISGIESMDLQCRIDVVCRLAAKLPELAIIQNANVDELVTV